MITIHNLRKNFGTQTAVDIENYTINQGEMVGWWVTWSRKTKHLFR